MASLAEEVLPPDSQNAASDEQGREGVGGEGEGVTQAEVDEAWERAREMEVSASEHKERLFWGGGGRHCN